MARPRLYSSPERKERIRASKRAWALRNTDKVRACAKRERTAPGYKEQKHKWYLKAKQAKLDAGFCPKPRGRPRVYGTEEERLAARRRTGREHMRKRRANARSQRQTTSPHPGLATITFHTPINGAQDLWRESIEHCVQRDATASFRGA